MRGGMYQYLFFLSRLRGGLRPGLHERRVHGFLSRLRGGLQLFQLGN